jgi:hypothetical protein
MAVPVASKNAPPLSLGPWGPRHQIVKPSAGSTFAPSHFNPVPVASALKGGTTGLAYSETISAVGGTAPYSFAVTSGALPTGATLNSATGVISGTPTVAATAGFTITVTDTNGFTGSQAFTIIIAAPASSGGGAYPFVG